VLRLPNRRCRQRGRLGEAAQPEAGTMLIDECDDLRTEIAANRAPACSRRTVADPCCAGRAAPAGSRQKEQRGQDEQEGP
jgi:hypothetical protein